MKILGIESLPELVEKLSSQGPKVYKLCGIINSVIQGLIPQDILVDSWPDFSTVIIRPCEKTLAYVDNIFSIYTTDILAARQILLDLDASEWKQKLVFGGVDSGVAKMLRGLNLEHGDFKDEDRFWLFEATKESLKSVDRVTLPSDFQFTSLELSDLSVVAANWPYSDNTVMDYLQLVVKHFVTCAVRHKVTHDLVGWMVENANASLGILCIIPEYRGKGIGKALVQHMADTLLSAGKRAYVYVNASNDTSIALHEKCGFIKADDFAYEWIRYTPKCDKCSAAKCCV